jgi:hypothetical protein
MFYVLNRLVQRVLNDVKRTRLSRLIWLLAYPPPLLVSKLDWRPTGRLRKERTCCREEGRGKAWSESYDSEKAWYSINRSVLSDMKSLFQIQWHGPEGGARFEPEHCHSLLDLPSTCLQASLILPLFQNKKKGR